MIQVFNCYLYPGKHLIDHFLDVSFCRASDCRAGGGGEGGKEGGGRGFNSQTFSYCGKSAKNQFELKEGRCSE